MAERLSDGELCRPCGEPVGLVWMAPDYLWMKITGTCAGVLCQRCFSELAEAVGILV